MDTKHSSPRPGKISLATNVTPAGTNKVAAQTLTMTLGAEPIHPSMAFEKGQRKEPRNPINVTPAGKIVTPPRKALIKDVGQMPTTVKIAPAKSIHGVKSKTTFDVADVYPTTDAPGHSVVVFTSPPGGTIDQSGAFQDSLPFTAADATKVLTVNADGSGLEWDTGGGGGADLWKYTPDGANKSVVLNPVFPGYDITSKLVFPLLTSEETNGTFMMFDPLTRAFRAGTTTLGRWQSGNRGPNSTAFGSSNEAKGENASALGGEANFAINTNSAVVAGSENTANSINAAILAGQQSVIQDTVVGLVVTSAINSVIAGGSNNQIFPNTSPPVSTTMNFIGAGGTNYIFGGDASALCAGQSNQITGSSAFLGAGQFNNTAADGSLIGAGFANFILSGAVASAVCAGDANLIGGLDDTLPPLPRPNVANFIGAGASNLIGTANFLNIAPIATNSAIVSGASNQVQASYSFIGGGTGNLIQNIDPFDVLNQGGMNSFIGGGEGNTINNTKQGNISNMVICGGLNNTNNCAMGFIGGGQNHVIDFSNSLCTITGGDTNQIIGTANSSTISGGQNNTISNSVLATIGGGGDVNPIFGTNIGDGSDGATIGGGGQHTVSASSAYATIGGGLLNTATGFVSTVCGGTNNTAATYAVVCGGNTNVAATYAVVCGGNTNVAAGDNSFIGGGASNSIAITGTNSTIPGGNSCTADGPNSFAAGTSAHADDSGSFVWSDASAPTDSTGTNTFTVGAAGGTTFWSDSARSLGVTLAPSGISWTVPCDRNKKENIEEMDPAETLSRIERLPLYRFNYKGGDPRMVTMGPMAQDWSRLFPSGKDPLRIETMDLDGAALASIKGLASLVRAQATEIAGLRSRLDAVEGRM